MVEHCNHCVAAFVPPLSRKVALGVLNRSCNDVVMVDHFYLDQVRIFQAMDSYSIFSAAYIVSDATLDSAPITFESICAAHFCAPESVRGDQAFVGREFQQYHKSHGISYRPVPSRSHHKNTLGPKPDIIRSIHHHLRSATPEALSEMLAI